MGRPSGTVLSSVSLDVCSDQLHRPLAVKLHEGEKVLSAHSVCLLVSAETWPLPPAPWGV